jgi:bacillithiol biosynthesis cysteine-adding enzyme BshC
LAPDGEVRKIRLEGIAAGRHAVSRTPVPAAAWEEALDRLARALPDSAHKPALLADLRETVADAPTLTVAFARLLARWFGGEGLLLMDADDPAVRRLEGPFFRALIEQNEELAAALQAGEARVRALGFEPQADVAPDGANLFVHHELGRLLLVRRDGRFADRRGLFRAGREELVRLAETEPERLSNGALSRPLMQEYVLPVLATVLGPAEIAYWGLLGPAFERFGMAMPVIVPRPSFTFLDPQTASLLERFSLTPEEAIWHWEERRNAWLAGLGEWRWHDRFRAVREGFAVLYDPLLEALVAEEPGLRDLGRVNRERIFGQIDYLERKAKALFLSRHDAALRQWDRIRAALLPLGRPQERVLGPVHYLNGCGPSWLRAWLATEIDTVGGHRLVQFEQTVREACQVEYKA